MITQRVRQFARILPRPDSSVTGSKPSGHPTPLSVIHHQQSCARDWGAHWGQSCLWKGQGRELHGPPLTCSLYVPSILLVRSHQYTYLHKPQALVNLWTFEYSVSFFSSMPHPPGELLMILRNTVQALLPLQIFPWLPVPPLTPSISCTE